MKQYLQVKDNNYQIYLAHTKTCDPNLIVIFKNEFVKDNITLQLCILPTIFAVHGGSNTLGLVTFKP